MIERLAAPYDAELKAAVLLVGLEPGWSVAKAWVWAGGGRYQLDDPWNPSKTNTN
jgi:hypothetical protein